LFRRINDLSALLGPHTARASIARLMLSAIYCLSVSKRDTRCCQVAASEDD